MSAPNQAIEGGCHCGAVRYRIAERPTYSMICHCRTCQRVANAPVVAWVSAPVGDFSFIKGGAATYKSSPDVTRRFCAACGGHLTYARDDQSDWIDIATASLDEPGLCPPTHHSWLEHAIHWARFEDGLPHFKRSRDEG